jgi:hypothetical protein
MEQPMKTAFESPASMANQGQRAVARFIPAPDVSECHETLIHAPAELVFDVAQHFDMQSIPIIRGIFRLRSILLRSKTPSAWSKGKGLIAETTAMGWGVLALEPGRTLVAGALAQPWLSDVTFTPVSPDKFAAVATPDVVKIAWTLEADPLGAALTRFRTETRVVATDEGARRKFRRYWRIFGVGIVLIRWLLIPAVRRESERRYRAMGLEAHAN